MYSFVPRVLQLLAWAPTVLILKLFCHYKVYRRENLKGLQQAIFACNHSGELDPILVTAAVLPLGFTPMFYVAAPDKEFNHSFFGWRRYFYKGSFFRAWGSYPIARGTHDYATSLAAHERIIKDGHNMCIFPEGGVSTTGEIREGRGGVGYLLYATGVPVVPVYIAGTGRDTSAPIFSGKKKISVTFGEPVQRSALPSGPSVENYKLAVARIMSSVKKLSGL